MGTGTYAALFSGGKDSYLALDLAREAGYQVEALLTVDAPSGSHLYHTPALLATSAIADALDIEHHRIEVPTEAVASSRPSTEAAERELTPLIDWLDGRLESSPPVLDGIVSGVVASRYQHTRLDRVCEERALEFVSPLWGWTGEEVLQAVADRSISADIVAVAAEGLDRSWVGRRLDSSAIDELGELADRYGLHPAGEGGEFETLVVDAPAFEFPIHYDGSVEWAGDRGHMELTAVGIESA